jgi:Mn2+/Fe2+ NRAMP family transporter
MGNPMWSVLVAVVLCFGGILYTKSGGRIEVVVWYLVACGVVAFVVTVALWWHSRKQRDPTS